MRLQRVDDLRDPGRGRILCKLDDDRTPDNPDRHPGARHFGFRGINGLIADDEGYEDRFIHLDRDRPVDTVA